MGRWSREELETEFDLYKGRALRAATSGDWRAWADQFTEDATYIEHHFGTFGGREAIYRWIQSTMSEWPNKEMTFFPVDWHVIDEDRGWVIFKVQNRFGDPGDGSVHQEYNISILHYAGQGLWSYEEDIYNPANMGEMVMQYLAHKKALSADDEKPAEPR